MPYLQLKIMGHWHIWHANRTNDGRSPLKVKITPRTKVHKLPKVWVELALLPRFAT